MSYTSYEDIPRKLSGKHAFKGNSMRAEWTDDDIYLVYSYSTIIAEYDPRTRQTTLNDTYYSRTTTRQQNLCKAWM